MPEEILLRIVLCIMGLLILWMGLMEFNFKQSSLIYKILNYIKDVIYFISKYFFPVAFSLTGIALIMIAIFGNFAEVA